VNTFTFLAGLGVFLAVAAFVSGARAQTRNSLVKPRGHRGFSLWRELFYGAVFLAILSAPLAR
jgi:hypothetical protein